MIAVFLSNAAYKKLIPTELARPVFAYSLGGASQSLSLNPQNGLSSATIYITFFCNSSFLFVSPAKPKIIKFTADSLTLNSGCNLSCGKNSFNF